MSDTIAAYIKTIECNLATRQATEHTHRPAFQTLLNALDSTITAVNEPKQRSDCGAPDFVILRKKGKLTSGHVEAKDISISLPDVAKSDQLKRYRKFLPNLILTNYVDFWWFFEGEHIESASLGTVNTTTGRITSSPDKQAAVTKLLTDFLQRSSEPIRNARDLAHRLAQQAHMIRDIVREAVTKGKASQNIKDLRHALKAELVPNLDGPDLTKDPQFNDLYAQTLTYGLFAAACNHQKTNPAQTFTLAGAAADIPKTNPLLRQLFNAIHGLDFEDEPHARFVQDIVATLSPATIGTVLKDFGTETARKDPVLHFYETFLAQYDPTVRERRGVYYTPEPVVGYIVRSVDHLLKTRFKIKAGLADTDTLPDQTDSDGKPLHRTLILDPAVGSGTFLFSVVQAIRDGFLQQKNAGLWKNYVHDHLLPRLHGFELLMAPYAMAHLKLGMQLAGQDMPQLQQEIWAYGSSDYDDRLRIYLTNTLSQVETHTQQALGSLQRTIHEEAAAADRVKRELPILVVLGNPPYSGISANNDPWIDNLLKGINADGKLDADRSYYHINRRPLGEKKVWLQDDYVKFIRWAQWRLEQTGHGILAFITNHGYLDNPTFRGMRWSLMRAFDEIYVLDLHGNAKKKEVAPDGSSDQNVFDIQQGVAIGLFVKTGLKKHQGKLATIKHADLWGKRDEKYTSLAEQSVESTQWNELEPVEPFYLFKPFNQSEVGNYYHWPAITDVMPTNVTGIVTAHDGFVIDHDPKKLIERMKVFLDEAKSDKQVQEEMKLKENYVWRVKDARTELSQAVQARTIQKFVEPILYQPFDNRSIFWHKSVVFRMRTKAMPHMLAGENLSLGTTRSVEIGTGYSHIFASRSIMQHHTVSLKEVNYQFPLYLYPGIGKADHGAMFEHWPAGQDGRRPNLDPAFVEAIQSETGFTFIPDGQGNLDEKCFGPEDALAYIYAVFHWPEYRRRFEPMLRLDYPRVPTPAPGSALTGDRDASGAEVFFQRFVSLGHKLLAAHLLEDDALDGSTVSYPINGDNIVAKGYPKYAECGGEPVAVGQTILEADTDRGRVYINAEQYFEGIEPDVWAFQIGGYQVCDKWLKDRRGRTLSYDELTHYCRVVEALGQTISLMDQIESAAVQPNV